MTPFPFSTGWDNGIMFIQLQQEQKSLKHRYYLKGLERIKKPKHMQVLFPISGPSIDLNITIFSQSKNSNNARDALLKTNMNPKFLVYFGGSRSFLHRKEAAEYYGEDTINNLIISSLL